MSSALHRFTILSLRVLGETFGFDPCASLNPDSICMDSGVCTPPLSLTCYAAYDTMSLGILTISDASPIVHILTETERRIARGFPHRSHLSIVPPEIFLRPDYIQLLTHFSTLSGVIDYQFPLIQVPSALLTNLVNVSQSLQKSILSSRSTTTKLNVLKSIVENRYVVSVIASVEKILSLIYSIDSRGSATRESIFNNFVLLFQTLVNVWYNLQIPVPFYHSQSMMDFLTFATQYEQPWYVLIHPLHKMQFVLPLVPPRTMDDFPMIVFDTLGFDPELSVPEAIELISRKLIDMKIDIIRSSLFYVMHFPGIQHQHRTRFCSSTYFTWMNVFERLNTTGLDHNIRLSVINLFRICGITYFTLPYRVKSVLPFFQDQAQPRMNNIMSEWPCEELNWKLAAMVLSLVPLGSDARTTRFLCRPQKSEFNQDITIPMLEAVVRAVRDKAMMQVWPHSTHAATPRKRLAMTIARRSVGIAIGLLHNIGDPNGTIAILMSQGFIPADFSTWSYNVLNGFCRIVNCPVLTALFSQDELTRAWSLSRHAQIDASS